jgi:hypothetical protein
LVESSVIATFAFGMVAPVESVTVPVRVPVTTWPETLPAVMSKRNTTNSGTAKSRIEWEREHQPERFVKLTNLFLPLRLQIAWPNAGRQ